MGPILAVKLQKKGAKGPDPIDRDLSFGLELVKCGLVNCGGGIYIPDIRIQLLYLSAQVIVKRPAKAIKSTDKPAVKISINRDKNAIRSRKWSIGWYSC